MIAWLFLLIAGIFEIAWAVGLKYSEGFTRLVPSIITVGLGILSFACLAQSLKVIPLGTAYAIWTGIGAVGTVIVGIFFFNESKDFMRLLFTFFILVGLVGLKFVSK